jgi:pyruvate kinase
VSVKILCTLGPASMLPSVIRQLDETGVDLFRLNLSHTPLEHVRSSIEFIQSHTAKPLCLDTDGAQVRCGLVEGAVEFGQGKSVRLTAAPIVGNADLLTLRPKAVFDTLQPGTLVSIDFDGVVLQIETVHDHVAEAVVVDGGRVTSNRAVSLDPTPELPALTNSDIEAIGIARELGIRHFALSFARRAKDVARLRTLGGKSSYIISKIETRAGVRYMDGIIAESDAILVDRGDLSREIPLAHVPMYQKEIIRRANTATTPALVATNLLESMVSNRRPTIAEANDIINTLLDGAHGLVLASETTIGHDPVASVKMILEIIRAFEWSRSRRLLKGPTTLGKRRRIGEPVPLQGVVVER